MRSCLYDCHSAARLYPQQRRILRIDRRKIQRPAQWGVHMLCIDFSIVDTCGCSFIKSWFPPSQLCVICDCCAGDTVFFRNPGNCFSVDNALRNVLYLIQGQLAVSCAFAEPFRVMAAHVPFGAGDAVPFRFQCTVATKAFSGIRY